LETAYLPKVIPRLDHSPVVNFTNILQSAFAPILFCQKIQTQTVIREKLRKTLSNGKTAREMYVKLTPAAK